MSDARFTEFDAQHVELLPARTVLTTITLEGFGGDGWGGDGYGGDGGDVFVGFNANFGHDQVITATGGAGGAGVGGDGEGDDGIEIEDNGGGDGFGDMMGEEDRAEDNGGHDAA